MVIRTLLRGTVILLFFVNSALFAQAIQRDADILLNIFLGTGGLSVHDTKSTSHDISKKVDEQAPRITTLSCVSERERINQTNNMKKISKTPQPQKNGMKTPT